ncbi:MAG: J domain-containing protein [Pirellulales bacterium]|nr:J domain-containing protein [Pirellulales bacterium]
MLLAASHSFPDALDVAICCLVLGTLFAVVISGHIFLAIDVRAWIRSLRRALVVIADHLPHFPRWARGQTPRCMSALGVQLPCSREQLLKAYRTKVKLLHPDRGGDRKRFMRLQADFEEAMEFLSREVESI